jgi:ribosome-associated translation inhibitor RaiA
MPTDAAQEFTIVEHGNAGPATSDHARARIAHAISHVKEPIGPVYLTLTAEPRHRRGPQASASVHVDIGGDPICAHANAPTLPAAIDLMHDRLRDQLAQRADRRLARRRGRAGHHG